MKAWRLGELDAGEDDRRFLAAMLYEAATWRPGPPAPPDAVLARSENARYVIGWGRVGDFGLVAVTEAGERLGAAWYRLFDPTESGYGFVSKEIPELSVARRGEDGASERLSCQASSSRRTRKAARASV